MIYTIMTNNALCPFCIKAKELLSSKGLKYEYKVVSIELLKEKFPNAITVPQIVKHGELDVYIGGYDDLYASLTPRTVFNEHNKGHVTGDYPLFFGEGLGFVDTINTPYPVLDKLYQQQVSQIWNEFEIDLTQDRQDMLTVSPKIVDIVVLNLLWQTLIDSVANRSITSLLLEFVSNSDLEAWYNVAAFFETIHARTYIHIIKQTFTEPSEALEAGYANPQILSRAKTIIDAFNAVAALPDSASLAEKKDAVYLAVFALCMLENVNFNSSFAVTFGVAETGVFQGISQDVTLICRDELLHGKAGRNILDIISKTDPHFSTMTDKLQNMFDKIMAEELSWNAYLFSEGRQYLGGNERLLNEYVAYLAAPIAAQFNLRPVQAPDRLPLAYMADYMDSSRVQVAAQEMQLTSYLVNAVSVSTQAEILALLEGYKY